MNDIEIFKEIEKIIMGRKELNNPFDDTYVRRLQLYPEFLKMPYWIDFREYRDIKEYLVKTNFSGEILDFGCGSGHMDVLLAREGYKVYGVDLSPMAIDIGNLLKSNEEETVQNRVAFSLEDITLKPKEDKKFDLVWSSHTLEHIREPKPIFDGIRNRVNKGGKMRISVPLGYAFNDPDHVNHWSDEKEFRNYFERFVIVEEVIIDKNKQTIIATFLL